MKKVVLIIGMMLFALGIVRGQSTGTVENMQQGTTEQVQIEEFVPKVIIEGKWGTEPGEFGIQETFGLEKIVPNSIAVDSKGNIYILDLINNRIQKFDSEGKHLFNISVDSWKGKVRMIDSEYVAGYNLLKEKWEKQKYKYKELQQGEKFPAMNRLVNYELPEYYDINAKGINIVIDSDDVLYYYLVREKENKGEVWEIKNDKFVKKWEDKNIKNIWKQNGKVYVKMNNNEYYDITTKKKTNLLVNSKIITRKKYIVERKDKKMEEIKILRDSKQTNIKLPDNLKNRIDEMIGKTYVTKEGKIRVIPDRPDASKIYEYDNKGKLLRKISINNAMIEYNKEYYEKYGPIRGTTLGNDGEYYILAIKDVVRVIRYELEAKE